MYQFNLSGLMSLEVYRTLLVFARIGMAFLLLPGYGEPGVPTRVRVLAGLGVAVAAMPAIGQLPATVPGAWGLAFSLAAEVTSGALIGAMSRTLISGVLSAGQVIGQSIGLSNIFALGVGFDQSATVGAAIFAGLTAALFAANGHHAILRALIASYDLIGPGQWPDPSASVRAMVAAGVRSFELAGQLALPFLLLGFLFNAGLAGVNRAMPALPVFMIASPALVVLGLYLLAAAAPGLIDQAIVAYANLADLFR